MSELTSQKVIEEKCEICGDTECSEFINPIAYDVSDTLKVLSCVCDYCREGHRLHVTSLTSA